MKTNMVKRLAAAMLAATVAIGTPMAVSAAWKTEGKGWNWTVNGQNATGWQMIDNTWYYFNAQGTMQTGWVQYGNSWFFLQPSGAMATGWVNDNGQYYYTKSNGAMATGWVQDNGTWYCMSSSGTMRTGWVASGNDWYYLAPTGAMVTGAVIKVDNAVYSIAADGSMQTGEVTIAGKTYTFGEDGAATGDNIPEPDRTFSSAATPGGTAAETTPTTPPADTTPTTPSKPNRPSYGGGGSTTPDPDEPDTPVSTVQTVTVRPVGNAGETPNYNYPAKYTAAGVEFSKTADNEYTIKYTPKESPEIPDELCQEIDKVKYGFIGLHFEAPEGAKSVTYTIGGGEATTTDLTGPDAENLYKGKLILYFGFDKQDGQGTLSNSSWKVELTWKDEAGETIVTRSATIKRETVKTGGDEESSTPSNPEPDKPSSEPSSEPSAGSSGTSSNSTPDSTPSTGQNETPTQLNLVNEVYESATPTNDGE